MKEVLRKILPSLRFRASLLVMLFVKPVSHIRDSIRDVRVTDVQGNADIFIQLPLLKHWTDTPPALSLELARGASQHSCSTEPDAIHLIYNISRLTCAKNILEIGTYRGACSLALAQAVMMNGGSSITSIDISSEYFENIQNNARYLGLDRLLNLIHASSADYSSQSPDNSFDLIFIDGDHGFSAVVSDIEAYWPKLKEGGLMLLHDSVMWEGVRHALIQMKLKNIDYSTIATSQGSGITLIIKA